MSGFIASGLGADPLGPLGPGLDVSALDFTSPWRLTAGATFGAAGLLYQRSDHARARRERRLIQRAFTKLGAGEPPSLLHPQGRPVDVEIPTPTPAGSSVVMKVPEGLNDRIMQSLAPTLAPMLRGQVTIRPVPPPATALKRAKGSVVASARRMTSGGEKKEGPRSAEQQLLAYGHMQIDIRRKEVLREGVRWKHLAEMRQPNFAGLSVWDGWHVGMDENGREVIQHLVQRDKISGGERGSGKSTGLHTDIAALALDPTARIILMDPSKFAEFRRWLPIAYAAAGTPDDCANLLEVIYQDGIKRLECMSELAPQRRANGFDPTNVMRGEITTWIVIDELLALTNHPDKNVRLHCQQRLYDIVTQLRKVGFGLICSTLKPTGEVIPTNLRDNLIVRESFRCSTPQMSLAVLGDPNWVQMGYGGHTLEMSGPRGISFLLADGHPVRKAAAFLSENERDEVLDVALRLRGLPALPPPPSAQEGAVVTDLSFGDSSVAPVQREAIVMAKAPAARKPEVPGPPAPAPVPRSAAPEDDSFEAQVLRFVAGRADLGVTDFEQQFGLSWDDAAGLIFELEQVGVLGPDRDGRREVLMERPAGIEVEGSAASGRAAHHYQSRRRRQRNRPAPERRNSTAPASSAAATRKD